MSVQAPSVVLRYLPTRRPDRPEVLFWSFALSAVLHAALVVFLGTATSQAEPYSAPVINVEMAAFEAIDEVFPDPWLESGQAAEQIGSAETFVAPQTEISLGSAPDGYYEPNTGELEAAGQHDAASPLQHRREAERLAEGSFSPGLRPRRIRRLHANSDLKTMENLYLNRWQRKVESVGVLFFPQELANLRGEVRVLVRLEASGRVRDIRVLGVDQDSKLSTIVRRILREAAPFPPLPDAMAQQTDILEIVRVWVFKGDEPGGQSNTLPELLQ